MATTPGTTPKATSPRKPAAKKPATKRASTTTVKRDAKQPVKRAAKAAPKRTVSGFSPATAFSIGAIVVAAGAALTGYFARRQIAAWAEFPSEGYRPDDLLGGQRPGPDDRAPDHFRPDPTAPLSAADRAALRSV